MLTQKLSVSRGHNAVYIRNEMDFPADPTYPFLISVIYMGRQRQARCICKNILAREEVERFCRLLVLCQGWWCLRLLILKNRKTVKNKRKKKIKSMV
jgi:hypothetical protein